MLDTTKTEQQIANNMQAFNDYVDRIRLTQFQIENTTDKMVVREMKKQIATYKKLMQKHLLQAQSLTQQVKSYTGA